MTMHTCSGCAGSYWGNALISRAAFMAVDNTWACLEVHAKLNTDMASDAGAVLEVWKNDLLIQRFPDTAGGGGWGQEHLWPPGGPGSPGEDSAPAPRPAGRPCRDSPAPPRYTTCSPSTP